MGSMLWKTLTVLLVILVVFIFVARKVTTIVVAERAFNAPVEKAWKLWTETDSIQKWWGPKDFTAPVIQNDFRTGGKFLFSMRSPKGETYWNTGTYDEIVPNRKIVSSMSFSDENGKVLRGSEIPVPGAWPDEISVTVEFTPQDGKTHVKVFESGIPLLMKVLAKMGWEQQFDKFEALL